MIRQNIHIKTTGSSTRFLVFCLLLAADFFLVNPVSAKGEEVALFNQANGLYKEKNYEGAITLYDSIARAGYSSAELFFNLGNAQFKAGNLAPAIPNTSAQKNWRHPMRILTLTCALPTCAWWTVWRRCRNCFLCAGQKILL